MLTSIGASWAGTKSNTMAFNTVMHSKKNSITGS